MRLNNASAWSFKLAPQLIGEAQQAYAALTTEEAADYEKLKKAILIRYEIINEKTLGDAGQTLGVKGQMLGDAGQTLGVEGQILGVEGQTLGSTLGQTTAIILGTLLVKDASDQKIQKPRP